MGPPSARADAGPFRSAWKSEAGALALYDRIRAAGYPARISSAGGGRRHLPVLRCKCRRSRRAPAQRRWTVKLRLELGLETTRTLGPARTLTGRRRRLQFQNKIRAPGPDLALIDHSVPARPANGAFGLTASGREFCLAQKSGPVLLPEPIRAFRGDQAEVAMRA